MSPRSAAFAAFFALGAVVVLIAGLSYLVRPGGPLSSLPSARTATDPGPACPSEVSDAVLYAMTSAAGRVPNPYSSWPEVYAYAARIARYVGRAQGAGDPCLASSAEKWARLKAKSLGEVAAVKRAWEALPEGLR